MANKKVIESLMITYTQRSLAGKKTRTFLRLFVDGGSATGKTYIINCIKQYAKNLGLSVMTCVYTGSGVDNLSLDSQHVCFQVADPHATSYYIEWTKHRTLVKLRKNIILETLWLNADHRRNLLLQ